MKYFPLIWAALWRRPTRLILTLLSVSVAFVLFGLMIGLNASFAHIAELASMDRVNVNPRFGGNLPIAERGQIMHIPGVTQIGGLAYIVGYYQDKKNLVFPVMADENMRRTWKNLPLTPGQWDQLESSRTGLIVSRLIADRWRLKAGDSFPILTLAPSRKDGTTLWPFTVVAVVEDSPLYPAGFTVGNYAYFDESRLEQDRETVSSFQVVVQNPDRAEATAHTIDQMFANSASPTRSISEKTQYESVSQAGLNIPFVTEAVAGAGLFMILFLTGNGIAQSVRERIPEFAMLKTLGFSDAGVMCLVFIEAAIPCLLGAMIGLSLAKAFASMLQHVLPPNVGLPKPYMPPSVLALAFCFAALVALISAVIPALRIKRLDVATALSGR